MGFPIKKKKSNPDILNFDNKNLNDLKEIFSDVEDLGRYNVYKVLRANGNNLSSLPNNIGRLTQLKKLYLSNNQLTNLPDSIIDLENLEVLHLSNNKLTNLPNLFGNLYNLKELYLSNNQLTNLSDSICDLKQLTVLKIGGNVNITEIPPCFNERFLPNLENIDEVISIINNNKMNMEKTAPMNPAPIYIPPVNPLGGKSKRTRKSKSKKLRKGKRTNKRN